MSLSPPFPFYLHSLYHNRIITHHAYKQKNSSAGAYQDWGVWPRSVKNQVAPNNYILSLLLNKNK